ncbi:carbohydrate ABC transporter permease [Ramlibacter albus]|uniref:sn-glycerol-3-phosphate transport system permease protein UgpE n=1 Tax=Ramlibacter albus TaxID=2079448 RepID=A0A923S2R4_9BURK|nr:carbohydrate ABC transporter permease [Ramlibacter albus]MBC5765621.1 carbohydrate ABC transporter permease [Ramlibacter albus]
MYPAPIADASPSRRLAYRVALYVSMLLWMAPLIAIFMTAARPQDDLLAGNYWGWPSKIAFADNFRQVFATSPMAGFFVNSVVVTVATVAGVLVLSTLAAVALAKYEFRGRTLLFAMFIAGNFLPYQILMIPVRELAVGLGLYNTVWALVVFHTAFQTGFATLFLRNFIAGLPEELFEAARIEGASELRILRVIVVPLIRPALAGLAVLVFTFVWNDYFWALALVQSDAAKPLTLGLAGLKGEWLTAWNLISAGALMAALPPVLLFFFMQKHFVAGLTAGAVRG